MAGSLPWAIQKANTDPGADEIVFVWGENDAAMQVITAKNTLEVTESVTISGPTVGDDNPGFARVVISGIGGRARPFWFSHSKQGDQSSTIRGVDFQDFDSTTMLAGSEIVAPNGQPTNILGGGVIVVERGDLSLDKCRFERNHWQFPVILEKQNGGGAVFVGVDATLNLVSDFERKEGFLIGSEFTKNTAEIGGAISNYGKITFDGAKFDQNMATNEGGGNGRGGAIFSFGPMTSVVNSSKVRMEDNKAAMGGSAI